MIGSAGCESQRQRPFDAEAEQRQTGSGQEFATRSFTRVFCTKREPACYAPFRVSSAIGVLVLVAHRRRDRRVRARPQIVPGRRACRRSRPESPPLSPDDGAEDVLHAARLSRRARRERAADPGAGRDRLGHRGPAVGGRDARLHGRHHRLATNTTRSAASSCWRTRTATAGWTSGRSSPTAWCSRGR